MDSSENVVLLIFHIKIHCPGTVSENRSSYDVLSSAKVARGYKRARKRDRDDEKTAIDRKLLKEYQVRLVIYGRGRGSGRKRAVDRAAPTEEILLAGEIPWTFRARARARCCTCAEYCKSERAVEARWPYFKRREVHLFFSLFLFFCLFFLSSPKSVKRRTVRCRTARRLSLPYRYGTYRHVDRCTSDGVYSSL